MPATPYFCLTKLFESGKINLCLDIFNFKKAIYSRKAQKLQKHWIILWRSHFPSPATIFSNDCVLFLFTHKTSGRNQCS